MFRRIMSPFSGSFLAIGRGHCPIQPPADFQEPSISKLGLRKFSTSGNFLRSQVITTRPTNPLESRHASTVWRLLFSNRRVSLTPLSRRPVAGRESRCQTPSSEIEKFSFPFPFFSSAFIRPSPANHVTTTSSGLRKIFQFFGLRKFFNFLFFDNLFPI